MTFKVFCVKTCISDKFHIVYEGQFYEVYEEIEKVLSKKYSTFNLSRNIYERFRSIYNWQEDEKEKFIFPVYELCDVGASEYSLGCFDKRNFLTLAEYRDYQINDILSENKLLN